MFVVVIVVCAVVLLTGGRSERVFSSGDDADAAAAVDDAKTRELVMSRANQFVLRINTYGPSDLDEQNKLPGYAAGVRELMTAKFGVDFDDKVTLAEQTVAQAGYARTVQLYATGLESLDSDTASVLVTGAVSSSYPDDQKEGRIEYEPLQFRYQVTMIKTEGQWLVDNFAPVTGEPEAGVPTEVPPTSDPTGAPGASAAVADFAGIVSRRQTSVSNAATQVADCGYPDPVAGGNLACAGAPVALGTAAATLYNSLTGAANPDSKVFVGAPPAEIAGLVDATRTAAADLARSASALTARCQSAETDDCASQRSLLTGDAATLTDVLADWEPYL